MGNLGKIFVLYTIQLITISGVYATIGLSQGSQVPPVDVWFQNVNRLAQRRVKVQFYDRVVLAGPEQNTYEVAWASITSTSPTTFGLVQVANPQLIAGLEPNSPEVGQAQGLVAFSDLQQATTLLSFNVVFTSGPYNGSTIAIFGRAPIVNAARELSIISGTGIFRLARGVVLSTPFSPLNASVSIFRYDLYVVYASA